MNSKYKRKTQTPLIYKKKNYPKPSREEIEKQIKKVKNDEDRVRASKLDKYILLEEETNFLVEIIKRIFRIY